MDFEFTSSIYVEECDLEEMVEMCKNGRDPYEAFDIVTCGWDDCDYYMSSCIEDAVVDEINKRLEKEDSQ